MIWWLILACIILVLGVAPCMLSSQISQAEEVLAHNAMTADGRREIKEAQP